MAMLFAKNGTLCGRWTQSKKMKAQKMKGPKTNIPSTSKTGILLRMISLTGFEALSVA